MRLFARSESQDLWQRIKEKWNIEPCYWYPLTELDFYDSENKAVRAGGVHGLSP